MIGQSVGSDASPLSCFLFRPRKSREKRRKRSHTNVSNVSIIRTSRVSQTPLQTPIPYFHQWVPHGKKALVAIACKTAYVRFHERTWVHTRLSEKNRTQRLTRRNRGLPSPGHSVVLCCQRNCHRKNSRRKWMHALRRVSAFFGAAAPLGCAVLLCICKTDKIRCNCFYTMVR